MWRYIQNIWAWVKAIFSESVGVLLTAMFVGVLFLVVTILAALQFRDTIQNSAITPKPNAGNVRQGVQTLEWRGATQEELDQLRNKRDDVDDKLSSLQHDIFTYVRESIQVFTDPKLVQVSFPVAGDPAATNYLKVRDTLDAYRTRALGAINQNEDAGFRKYAKRLLDQMFAEANRRLQSYDQLVAED